MRGFAIALLGLAAFLPAAYVEGQSCQSGQFRCNSGQCISAGYKCDGYDDCNDRSDETSCGSPSPAAAPPAPATPPPRSPTSSCQAGQFRCNSGQCISAGYKCDGYDDCNDRSDESNCASPPSAPTLAPAPSIGSCGSSQFRCSSGQCISSQYKCDGYNDCADQSDEANCPSSGSRSPAPAPSPNYAPSYNNVQIPRRSDLFYCDNQIRIIRIQFRCDGSDDCGDSSDEKNCPSRSSRN